MFIQVERTLVTKNFPTGINRLSLIDRQGSNGYITEGIALNLHVYYNKDYQFTIISTLKHQHTDYNFLTGFTRTADQEAANNR